MTKIISKKPPFLLNYSHQNIARASFLQTKNPCLNQSRQGFPFDYETGKIRTSDPQIRNLMLYPAELRSHYRSDGDLNPGYRYQYTSLAGKRLRPLGHRSFSPCHIGRRDTEEPMSNLLNPSSNANKNGWRGIRTPGGLHLNGFQDRRLRPLGHPSNSL